jgi:hypothetical protein
MLFRIRHLVFGAFLALALTVRAQSPAPSSPPPKPLSSPTPPASVAPTPTTDALINSLGASDLQQAIPMLKSNYINPEALNEAELNRATLQGLLTRLGHGLMLLPDRSAEPTETAAPFFSEILDGHIGYLRLGAFTKGNLQAMDTNLQTFAGKKVDALIVDLRASSQTNDFAIAAEFTKRFAQKGKPLFTLRKPAAKQERIFTSDMEPSYQGMVIVLTDGDTAGASEALAGVLRFYDKAMVIGQATAGRAVEYSDLQLPSGKVLRVAVAEAVLPEGKGLFPGGVKPDVPVEMSASDKRQIFQQSAEKGMSQFVFEAERPHFNEAALLAGTNPDIDAIESAQRRNRPPDKLGLRDSVVQRAVDLVTSLAIYQKR